MRPVEKNKERGVTGSCEIGLLFYFKIWISNTTFVPVPNSYSKLEWNRYAEASDRQTKTGYMKAFWPKLKRRPSRFTLARSESYYVSCPKHVRSAFEREKRVIIKQNPFRGSFDIISSLRTAWLYKIETLKASDRKHSKSTEYIMYSWWHNDISIFVAKPPVTQWLECPRLKLDVLWTVNVRRTKYYKLISVDKRELVFIIVLGSSGHYTISTHFNRIVHSLVNVCQKHR